MIVAQIDPLFAFFSATAELQLLMMIRGLLLIQLYIYILNVNEEDFLAVIHWVKDRQSSRQMQNKGALV